MLVSCRFNLLFLAGRIHIGLSLFNACICRSRAVATFYSAGNEPFTSEAEQQRDPSVRIAHGFVGQSVWGSVSCKKPRVLNPLGHKSLSLLDLKERYEIFNVMEGNTGPDTDNEAAQQPRSPKDMPLLRKWLMVMIVCMGSACV